MNLKIKCKTGFKVTQLSKPILILDYRDILFYDTSAIEAPVERFNLPPGEYWIEKGYFETMENPRVYKLAKLPPPERFKPKPTDFEIDFADNPHKCSIIWDEKRIVFDSSFMSKPLPELYFILYHEFGHAMYATEKYCDLYASNQMLVDGFNPSQISYAHILTLGDSATDRKEFVLNEMIKNI